MSTGMLIDVKTHLGLWTVLLSLQISIIRSIRSETQGLKHKSDVTS